MNGTLATTIAVGVTDHFGQKKLRFHFERLGQQLEIGQRGTGTTMLKVAQETMR